MASPTTIYNLAGKLVLITGSTLGIGKAAAKAFVAAGATVLINGRSQERVDETVTELNSVDGAPGKAIAAVADASSPDGIALLQAAVEATGSPLDVLMHNIGVFGVADFFKLTDEDWTKIIDVNVMSTVRICRAFLRGMLDRDHGHIVVVSSECGIRGLHTMPHYAMTKAAQLSLVRSLAGLTRGTNVRINAVVPGPTWTEGVAKYMEGVAQMQSCSLEDAIANYFKVGEPGTAYGMATAFTHTGSLLERFLTAEEVANACVFLASDASHGMSGTAMRVEGGMLQSI